MVSARGDYQQQFYYRQEPVPFPAPMAIPFPAPANTSIKVSGTRITITLQMVRELFGSAIQLPLQVQVVVMDVSGEETKQLVWLRNAGTFDAFILFAEPVLSKIKSHDRRHRTWSLAESRGLDNFPCLLLELGEKKDWAHHRHLGGVVPIKDQWRAMIGAKGKNIVLGYYSTDDKAARIYDSAVYYLNGAQAELNFPEEEPEELTEELKNKIDLETNQSSLPLQLGKEENRITAQPQPLSVNLTTIMDLLGYSLRLPMKVKIEVHGEESQLVWLKDKGNSERAFFYFDEPLLSKVRRYNSKHRRWSLGVSGSDGIPRLVLELGVKKDGSSSTYMGIHKYLQPQPLVDDLKAKIDSAAQHEGDEECGSEIDRGGFVNNGRWSSQVQATNTGPQVQATNLGLFFTEEEEGGKVSDASWHNFQTGAQAMQPETSDIAMERNVHEVYGEFVRKRRRTEEIEQEDEEVWKVNAFCSDFLGVNHKHGKWQTRIRVASKQIFLGLFLSEEEAARVYDSANFYLKGAKAYLNFPDEHPQPLSQELISKIEHYKAVGASNWSI